MVHVATDTRTRAVKKSNAGMQIVTGSRRRQQQSLADSRVELYGSSVTVRQAGRHFTLLCTSADCTALCWALCVISSPARVVVGRGASEVRSETRDPAAPHLQLDAHLPNWSGGRAASWRAEPGQARLKGN